MPLAKPLVRCFFTEFYRVLPSFTEFRQVDWDLFVPSFSLLSLRQMCTFFDGNGRLLAVVHLFRFRPIQKAANYRVFYRVLCVASFVPNVDRGRVLLPDYRVLPSFTEFFFLRRRGHASHHVPSFVLFFYLVRPLFFFKLHHINVLRFDPTRNEPSKTR